MRNCLLLMLACLCMGVSSRIMAQAQMASSQNSSTNGLCVGCSVSNPANAVDTSKSTYSSIQVVLGLLGGNATQTLSWPTAGGIGDTISIYVHADTPLVSLALFGNVMVETFKGSLSNNDKSIVYQSPLLRILSMDSSNYKLSFRATAAYDRIAVSLDASVAGLLKTLNIAYVTRSAFVPGASSVCTKPIAYTAAVSTGCVNCQVKNPDFVLDDVDTSYTSLNVPAGVAGSYARASFIFMNPSKIGDSITLIIRNNSGLLNLNLLSQLTATTFNGSLSNNDPVELGDTSILSVHIGPPAGYDTIVIKPMVVFDRIQIQFNSKLATSVLSGLRIYQVCRSNITSSGPTLFDNCHNATAQSSGISGLACVGCSIDNPDRVIDSDPNNYSTLNVPVSLVGGYAFQTLLFPTKGNAGDSIVLIIENAGGLLSAGLINTISTETFVGLTSNGDAQNLQNTTLSLLPSTQRYYYVLKPTKAFDRVTIKMSSGLLGALTSLRIYSACIRTSNFIGNKANPLKPVSESSSTSGLCIGCGVSGSSNAIDGDEGTYSNIQTFLGIGGYVEQTYSFSAPTCAGDHFRIIIENPSGLLSTTLLGNTQLVLLTNGVVEQTIPVPFSSLTLLSGPGNRYLFDFAPDSTFNQAQVRLNAGIGVMANLRVYEVSIRKIDPPTPASVNNIVCRNSSITLSANAPADAIIEWLSSEIGGLLLDTGKTFTTPLLTSDTTYWLQSRRIGGCENPERIAVNVIVQDRPTKAALPDTLVACIGGSITIEPQPSGLNFNFFADAAGTRLVYTGPSFTLTPVFQDTVFYVQSRSSLCLNDTLVKVYIKTTSTVPLVSFDFDNTEICTGQAATIQVKDTLPGAIYSWYTAPVGGTSVFTGTKFVTGALAADTAFYVETELQPCGLSLTRAKITIDVITGNPSMPVVNDTALACYGDTVLIAAQTKMLGGVIRWFDSLTGGNLLYTGATYTRGLDSAMEMVYAEVYSPCGASSRQAVTLLRNGDPNNNIFDTAFLEVCVGTTLPLTSPVKLFNGAYRWYTQPTGGLPVSSTDTLNAVIGTDINYYLEFELPAPCGISPQRKAFVIDAVTQTSLALQLDTVPGCFSDDIILRASSKTYGAQVYWYDSTGNLLDSGNTFIANKLQRYTTYFAEARSINCSNSNRIAAVAIRHGNPDGKILIMDTTACYGSSLRLSAEANVPDATYYWYDSQTGGNLLFIGKEFQAPPATKDTTYWIDFTSATTGCNALARTSVRVLVRSNSLIATIPSNYQVCDGDSVYITVSNINSANYRIIFDGGTPTTDTVFGIKPTISRNYKIVIYNVAGGGVCDTLTLTSAVQVNPKPVADFTAVGVAPANPNDPVKTYQFSSSSSSDVAWSWFFGDGGSDNVKNPTHTYADTGKYTVKFIVTNTFGCVDSITKLDFIHVKPVKLNGGDIFIPTAFSPDNNGTNDFFKIYGTGIQKLEVRVFNQYGNVVFETTNPDQTWDGTFRGADQPSGVYFYTAVITDMYGNVLEKQGNITLTR